MPEVPQSFDRFEVIRILGQGGMGTVYLARDRTLGRQVALKVLKVEASPAADREGRFLREARAAGAIRHPNIATIHEVDTTAEGQPFIVMEYCEGETLSQRIRRRPLDAGEFLSIARQIAAGLEAAHGQGVVHRDIKSANVILEPNGLVKILDFGLAKVQPRENAEPGSFESTGGHFFGTLHYLSPEQARGDTADARSDLFSVGVVLYQMASGHLPFNGDTALLTLSRIRDGEPEPFTPLDPAFPIEATRVIARLLQKNPEERFQSARELIEALDEIDLPTVRYASRTRSTSLGRTVQRPRWGLLAFVLLAFVAGAAAIYFVRQQAARAPVPSTAPPPPPPPIRSIAVLPLDNLANNQKDAFLSVALADALVTRLQKVPTLQVRPTSAVLTFRSRQGDAKSAGQRLGVDGVLEGHFLAAGDLVRVTLQLTDARTGYNVWADTVDGKRADLLALIDSVTARTADALNTKLGMTQPLRSASEPRSQNPRAYEQYLRARAMTGSFTPAQFSAQLAALRKAIELDPTFAAAYADLAVAISVGSARGQIREPDALQKAEWYARQAVRLDPNLPTAHLALGRVFIRFPNRFRESVREALAAIRLDPNDPQTLWTLSTYFISTGDLDKAQCVTDRFVQIDPGSNEAKTRGYFAINAVDPEGALELARIALASKDTALAGHDIRGVAYVLLGNIPAAEVEANAANALVPGHYLGKSLRALIAAAQGNRPACEAAIASFEAEGNRNHWAAIRIAQCYAKLGDRDKAIQWLTKAADLGHHSWYALIKHPWFVQLQPDPGFQAVVARIKADLDDVHDDVAGVYQLICH